MEALFIITYLLAGTTTAWLANGLSIEDEGDEIRWLGIALQVVAWPLTIPYFYVLYAIATVKNRKRLKEQDAEYEKWSTATADDSKAWDDSSI